MRLFVLRHRQVLNKVESSLNETEAGDSLSKKLREMIDKNKLEIMVAERTARVKGKMKTFPGKGKGIQKDGLPKGKTYKHSTGRVWGPQSRRSTEVTEEEEEWWDEEEEEEEERDEDDAWDWDHRSNQSGKSKESKGSQKPKGKKGSWKGWEDEWWYPDDEKQEPADVKNRTEELAECLAHAELAFELSEQRDRSEKLLKVIAAKWRESAIPNQLLGYHLLHAAQLSASERSTILSTTQAQNLSDDVTTSNLNTQGISLSQVEKALLQAWQDKELIERDDKETRKAGKKFHKSGKSFATADDSSGSDDARTVNTTAIATNDETSESSGAEELDAQLLEECQTLKK
jgi:hypothetical protein